MNAEESEARSSDAQLFSRFGRDQVVIAGSLETARTAIDHGILRMELSVAAGDDAQH